MNSDFQIVFKKNSDNTYSFSDIFVVPSGSEAQLDVAGKSLDFRSGLVCTADDADIFNFFQSDSDNVRLYSQVRNDDGCDDFFSVIVTSNQIEKWLPRFQLNNDSADDGLLSLLAHMYKKCDGINNLIIKSNDGMMVKTEVSFIENKNDVSLRSIRYLQKMLSLTNTRPTYDTEMKEILGLADALNIKINDYIPEEDEEDEYIDFDVDVENIISEIKKRVVAQDHVVEALVNNIYTNQKIIDSGDSDFINAAKVNILLDGPTGTGKTLAIEQTAKQLSLPVVVRPITSFSTVGYKGADLTELLTILLEQAEGNLALAERGIIALDEFDKLSYQGDKSLEIKKALQQELLSYLGGGRHIIDYRGRRLSFDTSKITFIGFGSFDGLRERKIKENNKSGIGFVTNQNDKDDTYNISMQDYIDEGIQKEVMGRFSLFISTNPLDRDSLIRIMKESSISPIDALIKVGKIFGVEIVISDEIISKIADYAIEDGTGARGLKTIVGNLKNLLLKRMISSRIDRVVIDEELLKKSRGSMTRKI